MAGLTEKGKNALSLAIKFFENQAFSAADLSQASGEKIASATLAAVANQGYLIRKDTKPVTYTLIENAAGLFNLERKERKGCDNSSLRAAQTAKRDEFYTRYEDIEAECIKYKQYFLDKTIYLNCDDTPEASEFFKFFVAKFDAFGLKKLIATHFNEEKSSYGHMLYRDLNGDGFIDMDDIEFFELSGDGDFRSPECVKILKESDIVITNPPFSLFREFVDQLIEFNKFFLIIGNENAIGYKNVFAYIKENKIWEGYNQPRPKEFFIPDDYNIKNLSIDKKTGKRMAKFGNTLWFTNLPVKKRNKDLILTATYYDDKNKRELYQKYDNYDAINVNRIANIPKDYYGLMGVPITFISQYNSDQFEIVDITKRGAGNPALRTKIYTKEDYSNYSDLNGNSVLIIDGKPKIIYTRLLIKRK